MAIINDGRLEYEVGSINVNYPNNDKEVYFGSTPLIVPNNWVPPVKKTLKKGSIITMADKDYRIIKLVNNNAVVLSQEPIGTQSIGDGATEDSVYFDTPLNTYLNNTYYTSLSTEVQDAILEQTLYIPSYNCATGSFYSDSFDEPSCNIKGIDDNSGFIYKRYDQYCDYSGKVFCYLLSLSDIIEYFDITLSNKEATIETISGIEINKLYNINNTNSKLGFRTEANNASAHAITYAMFNCATALFYQDYYDTEFSVYPAFQIDLSKVEYTIK